MAARIRRRSIADCPRYAAPSCADVDGFEPDVDEPWIPDLQLRLHRRYFGTQYPTCPAPGSDDDARLGRRQRSRLIITLLPR
jgi:hypothetical protein